jgi:protein SCO1/2
MNLQNIKDIIMKKLVGASFICISMLAMSCRNRAMVQRMSCCAKDASVTAAALTGGTTGDASIYQLPGTWTDQHSRPVALNQLKGKVQVVAMVFTHCGYACPRIVEDMKAIEDSLPGPERNNVGYVLVSFDAQRDNASQLARFAADHGLDDRWLLLHGNPGQVRELSMLLNVKYQETAGGNFNHTNSIFILDREGRPMRSLEGLDPQTAGAVNTIKDLVNR